MNADTLLEVRHLKKYFKTKRGTLHAVDDVNFSIGRGRTLGVVGESGCGKSTTGRVVLRLLEATEGEILFEGKDIRALKGPALRRQRREMQMIFQDPFSSLDPRRTVSESIAEPMRLAGMSGGRGEELDKVFALMETVGLAERLVNAYPHELDGGRRQRIGIARALSVDPKFIVCDEPVSALDVSIQAQILNLMQELQAQRNLTYIFITHNLSVVNHFADDIAVMYLGQIVERSPVEELFAHPTHPYTQALLAAIPVPSIHRRRERVVLRGEISSPVDPKPGCRFANRCPHATAACREADPALREVGPGHFVACTLV
ncbi:ABC transporter ATP-binding protein [Oscillospiraceae bacterium]|nr:ABC transporter ATP-binding protein [Oscillospiraceae bacterium]BDF76217.1 ABC transporter ATP-binding protein [Oscillospiraceae bacterium]